MTSDPALKDAEGAQAPEVRDDVLKNPDFVKLWAGETISLFGTQVTQLALPLVAILTLGATAFEVGVLNASRYAPIAVVTLFAGVWLDRRRRRPILIGSNLGRAFLIGLIPLAGVLGVLSMEMLYVICIVLGTLTVIFDVGVMSYVPGLVERRHLADGNSKLQASFSASLVAGPGLGGLLVGLVTAPITLAIDAVSYLVSVVMMASIRKPEPEPAQPADRPSVWVSIGEGLRAVFGHHILRFLATQSATFNLFQNALMTVFVVYAVRDLGLTPSQLGLVLGTGAVGAVVGSMFANRISKAAGLGRTLRVTTIGACLSPALFLIPDGPDGVSLSIMVAAHAVYGVNLAVFNVNTLTLRQMVTPDHLLGRMNASYRLLLFGTIPIGALLGGSLGEFLGLRTALVIVAVLITAPILWTFFSPVFRLREMPTGPLDAEPAHSPTPAATGGQPTPAATGGDDASHDSAQPGRERLKDGQTS
jgi:MFS family permease